MNPRRRITDCCPDWYTVAALVLCAAVGGFMFGVWL